MDVVLALLTIQGVLGALDNFWHHEISERLPSRVSARGELFLHAAREYIYAALFITLAWFEPGGAWAWLFLFLIAVEIVITLWDFVIEDQTRKLPKSERILHTILAINFGAIVAYLVPPALAWTERPSTFVAQDHGIYSWVLTVYAMGVFVWALRNSAAALRLTALSLPEWKRRPIKAGRCVKPTRYLVTGATGFVGGHLCRKLIEDGHVVIVLTRDAAKAADRFGPHVRIVTSLGEIADDQQIDAIVHLAGAPVAGWLWTKTRKALLLRSRVATTEALVALVKRLKRKPSVFLGASAVGFYGRRGDEVLDEEAGGQDIFMSRFCRDIEHAAEEIAVLGPRVVALRIGLVLGRDGGVLPQLDLPVGLGLGAVLGSGRQWMPWIHIADLVRLVEFTVANDTLSGPVNAASPKAERHADVMRSIARQRRRPLWLVVPAWLLKRLLGELSDLFVEGQRVSPKTAMAAGFTFRFPNIETALADLLPRRPVATAQPEASVRVHFSEACPVCRWEIDHYRRIAASSRAKMDFRDISAASGALAPYRLSAKDAKARLWVFRPDGQLVGGVDAFIAIWSSLKGYRLLAKLVAVPGIRTLADALYDGVAAPWLTRWNARREQRTGRVTEQRSA